MREKGMVHNALVHMNNFIEFFVVKSDELTLCNPTSR